MKPVAPSILIVDDDKRLCEFMLRYFAEVGFDSSALTNSAEVMPWLAENKSNAVIVDLKMPHVDGFSLIAEIRQKYMSMPIIVFTGSGYDEEQLQKALKAGANAYVSKGSAPHEILAAVSRAMKGHTHSPTDPSAKTA